MCWRVTRAKNWETFNVSVHYRKNVDLNDNEMTLSGRWESECLDDLLMNNAVFAMANSRVYLTND